MQIKSHTDLLDSLLHEEVQPRGQDSAQTERGESVVDTAAHLHVFHATVLELRIVGIYLRQNAVDRGLQTGDEGIRRRVGQARFDHGIFGKQHRIVRIVERRPVLGTLEHVIHQSAGPLAFVGHCLGCIVQTSIPLATLLSEGVSATASAIRMLLEDENSLAALRKKIRTGTSAATRANNDGVQFGRHEFGTKCTGTDGADLANFLSRPGDVDEQGKDGQDGGENEERPQTDDATWASSSAGGRISHDFLRHWIEEIVHIVLLLLIRLDIDWSVLFCFLFMRKRYYEVAATCTENSRDHVKPMMDAGGRELELSEP